MTAFSKRIAATAAAAALTAGGVFAVATPAFAATTTPTATDEAVEAQLVVDSSTLESGTTAINWAATGLESGGSYTVELVAPEGTHNVSATDGNAYVVEAEADGTTAGEISWDDNSAFTDGDYTLTLTPATGGALTTTFVVGPQATETSEPTETATPEPTETETPEPTETAPAEDPTIVVSEDSLASGTTTINWAAAGFTPGAEYTVTLVDPEAEHDVPARNGNKYVIAQDGSTGGEISWGDNRVFTDGDYVIVIENVDGTESATVSFTIGATETSTPEPTETSTPEPTETSTPEPTETSTPEPTETEEPTPTATETEAEEAPALAIEKDTYTQSETLSGVNYAGAGWAPGVEITIEVTEPNGATTVISPIGDPEADIAVDENGEFAGTVTYTTYEDTNGNGQYDVGEPSSAEVLPVGDYTITATQDDVTETIAFSVVADASESIPASDDEDTSNNNSGSNGDSLAVTGADDAALLGMLAGGLVLVAAGATTMVVRRRQS